MVIYDSKGLEHGEHESFLKATAEFLKQHPMGLGTIGEVLIPRETMHFLFG